LTEAYDAAVKTFETMQLTMQLLDENEIFSSAYYTAYLTFGKDLREAFRAARSSKKNNGDNVVDNVVGNSYHNKHLRNMERQAAIALAKRLNNGNVVNNMFEKAAAVKAAAAFTTAMKAPAVKEPAMATPAIISNNYNNNFEPNETEQKTVFNLARRISDNSVVASAKEVGAVSKRAERISTNSDLVAVTKDAEEMSHFTGKLKGNSVNGTPRKPVSPASSAANVGEVSHFIERFKRKPVTGTRSVSHTPMKFGKPSLSIQMASILASKKAAMAKKPSGGYTTRRKRMRKTSSGKQTYKQSKQRKHHKRNTRKR
jgi:hypothetical protein